MKLLGAVAISLIASFAPCCCLLANANEIELREVVTVDVQQAKRLHDLGAVFIDIRGHDAWRIGHIDKALHFEFYQDLNSLKHSKTISKDTPLVFYCESSECVTAAYASAVSLYWGFDQVFYFQDGYFAWLLKDYPIQSLVAKLH